MSDTREVTNRRPTAMEQAAMDREHRRRTFVDATIANQAMIERSLKHHGLSFDFFMAALEVGMRNTMKADDTFFERVSTQSFLEAVLKATHFGLLPDGKEGAIVRYATEAAFLPMVEGFTKILWKTGAVVEINSNVVCEGDEFDFQEGDDGFVTHRRSLKRAADAEVIGAWCVIKLATGGKIIEICDRADLAKIASISKATKGPRVDWAKEMHRKAPFRRAVKRMPKTAELTAVIAHDDSAYDFARVSASAEAPAAPSRSLFSNRPAPRRERLPAAPEPGASDGQRRDDAALAPRQSENTAAHPADESAVIDVVTAIHNAQDSGELLEAINAAKELRPSAEEATWIQETIDATKERLAGSADATIPFVLRAIITSTRGEQEFTDPAIWRSDILTKMSTLSGKELSAFWKKNLGFVLDAGENGFDEDAGKIVDVAAGRGLSMEPS